MQKPSSSASNEPSHDCVARSAAYVAIALTGGLWTAFALDALTALAGLPTLQSAVDALLAIAFWSYLALTPVAAMLAYQRRLSSVSLVRVVQALSALWLLCVVALLFLPVFVHS